MAEIKEENIDQPSTPEEAIVFPTSYAQRRMWFMDQFEPGSPYYNIPMAMRLKGKFDYAIFERTINEIIKRHESLRTTFSSIDGNPVQVISESYILDIPVIDLTGAQTEVENKIENLASVEARKPFDISNLPLLRASILRVNNEDNVVLLTMHHIVSDGWSMGVLANEITTLYRAFFLDQPSPLPELEIQYADFSFWQQEYLQGEALKEQLDYWKKRLSNPPILELPTDKPRPKIWTNEGSSFTVTISKELLDRIKQIGYKEGATLFMTLMAAFKVLLMRYSGQDDVTVGTPIANRTLKETEPLIGIFINTLVLRTTLNNNQTFLEFLREEKKVILDAYENQDVPFEMIVDEIQPEREMSYSPLFQVMFILQNAPVKTSIVSDLELEPIHVDMGTATSEITFSISENRNGLSLSVEYNTDLFEETTIRRLTEHYQNILIEVVKNPNAKIKTLPLMNKVENQKILYKWNDKKLELTPNVSIHQLVERWAETTPDNTAVVFEDSLFNYKDLNDKANQIAHYLIDKGVKPDSIVAVCMEKSTDLMAVVLGVLKAGGAYLPIDPTYPQERIDYMIKDSNVKHIISETVNKDLFGIKDISILYLDAEETLNRYSNANPNFNVDESNLAYMIYTSGTTGKAKGTMIRHASLVNAYFAWEMDYKLLSEVRNHLQMASFSFDVFTGDWTRALCSGGKLVLVKRETLLDAETLYYIMKKEKVDIAEFVPAVLRNLIYYLNDKKLNLKFFKTLIAGSDVWYAKEYKEIKKLCGDKTRLINSFGLTEATIDTTFFEADNLSIPDERLVPIGKPFANMPVYILDEYLNPVPVGVRGELFVAGIGIARGYFNRPDLTAEKFLPNPYSNLKGERMYSTGDVARYLPNGDIEFLGRKDHQIKLRGQRIELGEIETAIGKFNNIKDVAVIAREDKPGDKNLVAYLILNPNSEIDTNEMRKYLFNQIPEYMIPSAFVILDELPLTPNGKVDRKSLPKPDDSLFSEVVAVDYVAPRNPVEEVVAKIWSSVLNIEVIGIYNNFFLLGGHSLLATQVISRIKKQLEVEIPLRTIFETPTVAALSKAIEKCKLEQKGISIPKLKIIPRSGNLPLSFAQQRLWFLEQLEPNTPFYNIPENYKINGELNIDALEKAINKVIERHETLRSSFHSNNGVPIVKIEDKINFKLEIKDLSKLDVDEKENKINEIIKDENKKAIPLNKAPLFNLSLLKTGNEEYFIVLVIHHIISDDWSTKVLMQEISILYDSYVRDIPVTLNELSIQYVDYAAWQKEYLSGKVLDMQVEYWKNQLSDIPPVLQLPTDRPRPAVQTFNGRYKSFELPESTAELMNKFAREESVTSFMILLAGFYSLLSRYSGQKDICVGTPVANRTQDEVENLIGFFVNTLVLRGNLSGKPTFREFLKRVRETSLEAYAHQDLPFEQVVEIVQPERTLSHSPLFQVMFTLQNTPSRERELNSGITLSTVEAHSNTSKFDLTLFMVGEGKHFGGAFEYNTDLFEDETIERMILHFEDLLKNLLSNPEIPIEKIPLIDNNEQLRILDKINSAKDIPRLKKFIPNRFNEVSLAFPNNIAVVCDGRDFTYQQLNIDSNKLANYLLGKGINSESVVGIYLKRSYQAIVSLLGVLKAGAAYLPLEPNYPIERLEYMIIDSGTKLLLTEDTTDNSIAIKGIAKNNLSVLWSEIEKEDSSMPKIKIDSDNLSYIIYTSGSTGKPKGTLITHKGLNNYLSWALHKYPLEKGIGSVVHSTLAFDATVTAVYPALLSGKTLHLVTVKNEIDGLKNILINNDKFSLVKITPAHLDVLSNLIKPEEAKDITHSFVIGGENLTAKQIQYWQKYAPDTLMFNEYGPTENVVGCIVYEASKYQDNGSVPIGKIIPGTEAYVLDTEMNIVPQGIPGELYLGGIALARGYKNRSDLTAEKFVPNPFSTKEGERLYKTGDLVKLRNDDEFEFLGRIDDQVKVRGYRIELGEIEETLRKLDQIKEAAVIAKGNDANDKQIIAFVTLQKNELSKDIKKILSNSLPDYMIPSLIKVIDKIPLTSNGKVDKKKLPDIKVERENAVKVYIPPKNDKEEKLIAIWQDILKVEKIGIKDNFFELGGHSLLVTQLIARVRDILDFELPVKTIFEKPTVEELAKELENLETQRKIPPLVKLDNKKNMPLSFNQQRLWFLEQLNPGQTIYNMQNAMKIKGEVNLDNLENAIKYVVNKQELLRTTFKDKNGIPYQTLIDEMPINIDLIDVNDGSEIKKILLKDAKETFDLVNGPLIRFKIITIEQKEFTIVFTMHHIISDGWSINILMEEIIKSYMYFHSETEITLEDLEIQYSDYAAWQRSWLKDEVLEDEINFWKGELSGAPKLLELPLDKPRPKIKTFNGSHKSFVVPETLTQKIKALTGKAEVTPFMFMLSVFSLLLSKYSNQEDIVIGTPIANRNRKELEKIIGFFANTVVIRTKLKDNPSFNELLQRVKESSLRAYSHQELPFERLVEELQPERDLSYTPIFQVMFVHQNNDVNISGMEVGDIEFEAIESSSTETQFDLTLSVFTNENVWGGTLEYNTDIFESDRIEQMITHFNNLLEEVVIQPEVKLSKVKMLSKDESKKIIAISKGREVALDNLVITKEFERVVKEQKEETAIEYKDTQITYSELNERSNKLANYLLAQGVKKDEIVGVMSKNGIDMITGMMGIMKAGSCYMPIDWSYPKERKQYMIEDSGIKILLTSEIENTKEFGEEIKIIDLSKEEENITKEDGENLKVEILPENLAYMIYTSGSTGRPKGVMLAHKGLRNLTNSQIKDFGVAEESKVLQFASLGFDASVSEIFMSLLSGATLVLIDSEKKQSTERLREVIEKKKITIATIPPSMLSVMRLEDLGDLKTIISAGERLPKEVAKKIINKYRLLNAYGPTESTIGVTSYEVKEVREEDQNIPIGRAIENVELYILDKHQNIVPEGVVGEICIGGIGLSRGYKGRAELTSEKFIPNPYSEEEGARLYRTGDLGRYTKGGLIEYIGRIDTQVKVRGYRIELGEIEERLQEMEWIKESAVIVKGEGLSEKKLIAYVVIDDKAKNEESENDKIKEVEERIKLELRKSLPEYMIPGIIQVIEKMPLTKNGKIDRKQLGTKEVVIENKKRKYIVPRTGI